MREARSRSGARRLTVGLAVLCTLLAPSCGGTRQGLTQPPRLAELEGAVTVNAKPAATGRTLAAGDVVRVPRGAYARLAYPDGSRILLVGKTPEGTDLTIGAETPEGGMTVMLARLGRGILSFAVSSSGRAKARYEIEAVSTLTVVRGTEGKVETAPAGDVVAIKSGEVDVVKKADGSTLRVGPGQQVSVAPSGAADGPRPYDFSGEAEQMIYRTGPIQMKVLTN